MLHSVRDRGDPEILGGTCKVLRVFSTPTPADLLDSLWGLLLSLSMGSCFHEPNAISKVCNVRNANMGLASLLGACICKE